MSNKQKQKKKKGGAGGGGRGERVKEAKALRSLLAALMELRSLFCSTECLEGDFVEWFSCPSCSWAVDAPRAEQQQRQKKKKMRGVGAEKKKNGQSKKYSGVETKEMKVKKNCFVRGRGRKQNLGEVQNQGCKLL